MNAQQTDRLRRTGSALMVVGAFSVGLAFHASDFWVFVVLVLAGLFLSAFQACTCTATSR